MAQEAVEPRRVTSPFEPIQGVITPDPLAVSVEHEPVLINHDELDKAGGNYRPIYDRASRTGRGMRRGEFVCTGDEISISISGGRTWCGTCLLEVTERTSEETPTAN